MRREVGKTSLPSQEMPSRQAEVFWRDANEGELHRALEAAGEALSPQQARLVLRNPFLTAAVLDRLLALRTLATNYQWRRDLVRTAACPLATAMAIVPVLFWRDLAEMARDVRVQPQLRRQSEHILLKRLSRLALGERIALARIASPALLVELRRETDPRVIRSLLENPRLTEGDLMPLLVGGGTSSTLSLIAQDLRWGSRSTIRLAIARNRNTPVGVALHILPSLGKRGLKALARDPTVSEQVKQRCRVLLGEER